MTGGKFTALILDRSTGEERLYAENHNPLYPCPDGHEGTEFSWTEGNCSCDCNRHSHFLRAGGERVDWNHIDCMYPGFEGTFGRFLLKKLTCACGEVLAEEKETDDG